MRTKTLLLFAMLAFLANSCRPLAASTVAVKEETAETVTNAATQAPHFQSKEAQSASISIEPIGIWPYFLDNDGYLWLSITSSAGGEIKTEKVFKLNPSTGEFSKVRDINGIIFDMAMGKDGSIWIATNHELMEYVNGRWITLIDSKDYFGAGFSTQKDGRLWISLGSSFWNRNIGAYLYDGYDLEIVQRPEALTCGFSSILEGNGELWATDGPCMKRPDTLRKYDNGKWTEIEGYYPSVLISDDQGNVWFVNDNKEIIRMDFSKSISLPSQTQGGYFFGPAFAPDHSIWLLNDKGIYNYADGVWKQIDVGNLPYDKARQFVVGQDGSLFIGTLGAGVFRYLDGKLTQFTF